MTLKREDRGLPPQQGLQNLEYVRQMLIELKATAIAENEALLVYLIEMAYLEACDVVEARKKSGVKIGNGNQSSGMAM